jgi:hypothetical protein
MRIEDESTIPNIGSDGEHWIKDPEDDENLLFRPDFALTWASHQNTIKTRFHQEFRKIAPTFSFAAASQKSIEEITMKDLNTVMNTTYKNVRDAFNKQNKSAEEIKKVVEKTKMNQRKTDAGILHVTTSYHSPDIKISRKHPIMFNYDLRCLKSTKVPTGTLHLNVMFSHLRTVDRTAKCRLRLLVIMKGKL